MPTDIIIEAGPLTFQCDYDRKSDVLYLSVSVGEPREGLAWESPEGHFVRLDPETDELVGITILHLRYWLDRGRGLTVTLPDNVVLPAKKKRQAHPNLLVISQRALSPCYA